MKSEALAGSNTESFRVLNNGIIPISTHTGRPT